MANNPLHICIGHHASQAFSPALTESDVEQTHKSRDVGLGHNNKKEHKYLGQGEPFKSPWL